MLLLLLLLLPPVRAEHVPRRPGACAMATPRSNGHSAVASRPRAGECRASPDEANAPRAACRCRRTQSPRDTPGGHGLRERRALRYCRECQTDGAAAAAAADADAAANAAAATTTAPAAPAAPAALDAADPPASGHVAAAGRPRVEGSEDGRAACPTTVQPAP